MPEVKNDVALIRKRDVQKLICKLNGCVGTIKNFENCEKRCFDYKAVDELPIVQQRQRVGRWGNDAGFDKCSECGASYSDLAPDYDRTNYCPNCGAKMNGSFDYVQLEKDVGRWVIKRYFRDEIVICSECGEKAPEESKYCPNCGAFMK